MGNVVPITNCHLHAFCIIRISFYKFFSSKYLLNMKFKYILHCLMMHHCIYQHIVLFCLTFLHIQLDVQMYKITICIFYSPGSLLNSKKQKNKLLNTFLKKYDNNILKALFRFFLSSPREITSYKCQYFILFY